GRGDAVDLVHGGLFHAVEELAGVGRKRLDVAPLPLGVDGVEDQRGFARAGDAGNDRQPVVGQVDGDVLEVMDPRSVDPQQLRHSVRNPSKSRRNRGIAIIVATRMLRPRLCRKLLLEWYQNARRPLPWRETRDPWRILLSEVM